jgi:chromosome segregation ATPase
MSLADAELTIGGVKLKGIYIAVVFSLATTIGGGVWTASSLYSRLEGVENLFIPNITPLEEKVLLIEQELEANDVSKLQGKLAELQTMLENIGARQVEVLSDAKASTDKVAQLEKDWIEVRNEYKKMADALKAFEETQGKFVTELDNLWDGLDAATNPLN